MTVADNTSRNQYTATSGQTVFAYTFEIVDKGDIVVLKNGTTLSEGTNYTVSNVGNDSGGNVTLTVGATAGDVLTLYRDMPYARTQNYTNSGDFLASEVNSDFDNLWLAGEQTNRAFSQSIRKPITDSDSISMELPEAATRKNSFLAFDATGAVSVESLSTGTSPTVIGRQQFTGDGTTTVFTLAATSSSAAAVIYIDGVYQEQETYTVVGTTLTFTEAPPTNASIEVLAYKITDVGTTDANSVTYTPAGTGAVQTTVQTKLRESVSVKDFGAVGDGVTDDTAAIQAALDITGKILIPKGSYKTTSQLIIKSNTHLLLDKNAIILRAWSGGSGVRPDNCTIKNENALSNSELTVDPGPAVISTFDTNIHIEGGQWGHLNNDSTTYNGTHIGLIGVRYGSFTNSQFNTQAGEWNSQLWVENFNVSNVQVNTFLNDGITIYNDGIHVIGGKHISISDIFGGTDDDLIALGDNRNIPISDVSINNVVCNTGRYPVRFIQIRGGSTSGFAAPTSLIERISVSNISGICGITNNGFMQFEIDGHTTYDLFKDISVENVNLKIGSSLNPSARRGLDILGGSRLSFSNLSLMSPVRDTVVASNANDLKFSNCYFDAPSQASDYSFKITSCNNVLVVNTQIVVDDFHAARIDNTTDALFSNCFFEGIGGNTAGLLIANTSNATVTGCKFVEKSGESNSQGIRTLSGATIASLTITGCDFTGVDNATELTTTPTKYKAEANNGEDGRTNAGSPSGSLTPYFVGEEVLDTTNTIWYKATGTGNTDWVALN
jgi:polygalacturonase